MDVGGKICPFRSTDQVLVNCESTCQLFVPAKTPQEGTCALAALPSLKFAIVSLDHTVATIRTTLQTRSHL